MASTAGPKVVVRAEFRVPKINTMTNGCGQIEAELGMTRDVQFNLSLHSCQSIGNPHPLNRMLSDVRGYESLALFV
eukprot:CAMPEP_0183749448 /NCGR_PEP_ID=MMETSP0737-20130205/68289_1 /TAXON_ID=385413 /ORGANISM="Thalassiosira miniscula, Strain CCMP1093" /LENGTH=75 /DNA_ID=CAMNT_0025985201 /DNA_START=1003 /DNA_END=1230 /DNA_ORIENTATION=+